jgi:hypothetical protein
MPLCVFKSLGIDIFCFWDTMIWTVAVDRYRIWYAQQRRELESHLLIGHGIGMD